MELKYKYNIKTSDLWQASMYYAYSSYLAVINVMCIVSAIALLIKLWATSPMWLRGFLILFLMLFTVIQPLVVWARAKSQLAGKTTEVELIFTEGGIYVEADGKSQNQPWKNVLGIAKKPTIVIVYMRDGNGYILSNKVLGTTRKELIGLCEKMISKRS